MLKRLLLAAMFGFLLFAGASFVSEPAQTYACGGNTDDNLLGIIPAWHHYLPCDAGGVNNADFELPQLWLIALAIFDGIVRLGGFVAVIFVIWGGVKYITSQGSPDGTASARKTIITAIAGLIITISAAVLTQFIFNLLSGGGPVGLDNVGDDGSGAVGRVFRFVYAVIGVVSVIYVVIGAIKFATSTGDPQKANNARNTIIYAIVGLLVVIAANVITSAILTETAAGPTGYLVR